MLKPVALLLAVLQVKNSDDFVAGMRYDRARIRRFLSAYLKQQGDRAPGKAGRE